MLTTAPGPDVALHHSRQIVLLTPSQWKAWLDPAESAGDPLQPLPEGALARGGLSAQHSTTLTARPPRLVSL